MNKVYCVYCANTNKKIKIMPPKKNYTVQQMQDALKAVEQGMSVARAAIKYKVPRITLLYKWKGKLPRICTMGRATYLTTDEENILVKWILGLAAMHYPISKGQLFDSVQHIIKKTKRETPFKEGRPGEKWFRSFLKRHPELSQRMPQTLSVARESVTEQHIRNWFTTIEEYLKSKGLFDITNEPDRIFNADESAFFLQPKGDRVIVGKGDKNVYSAGGDEKENVTVLVTGNASGIMAPPMVLLNYVRIPGHISSSIPESWGIGCSENGWMCRSTFYEYMTNIFFPWLEKEKITRPVLFFMDGHVSHMTLHVSEFCVEHGIELIALYPNSTHILQPMDVAVFKPLKTAWKQEVKQWKTENLNVKLQKTNFGPVFQRALNKISRECIINGFRASGLCPFNVENVKFEKISSNKVMSKPFSISTEVLLRGIEERIDKNKLLQFKNNLNEEHWNGEAQDISLYQFWKKLYKEKEAGKNSTDKEQNNGNIEETETINTHPRNTLTNEHLYENSNTPKLDQIPKQMNIRENEFTDPQPGTSRDGLLPQSPHNNSKDADININTSTPKNTLPFEVPSPFKSVLYWPETPVKSKKRKLEVTPAVVTSSLWREYAKRKEEKKKKAEDDKAKRALIREQKKAEKEKHTKVLSESEEDGEAEWNDSGDSLDDVDFLDDPKSDSFCMLESVKDIKIGDYLLVKFVGGKRNATVFRYACVIQNIFEKEKEFEVMGLKATNEDKKIFRADEEDISVIKEDAIIGKLPNPEMFMSGDRLKYQFKQKVDVFEA